MPRATRVTESDSPLPPVSTASDAAGAAASADRELRASWEAEARGHWAEAIERLVPLALTSAPAAVAPWARLALASLRRRRGEPGPRASHRTGPLATERTSEWLFARAEDLARAAVERADARAAHRGLTEMRRAAAELPGTWFRARLHLVETEVAFLSGDEAAAGSAVERAQEWAERLGRPAELGRALALAAELLLRRGDQLAGDELFEEAMRVLESAPARWEEGRAWERWGVVSGDAAAAGSRLAHAVAVFEGLDARPAAERVRAAIQQGSGVGEGRGRAGLGGRRLQAVEIAWRLHVAMDLEAVAAAVLDFAFARLAPGRARLIVLEPPQGRPRVIAERAGEGSGPGSGLADGERAARAFRRRIGYALAWGRADGGAAESESVAICQPLVVSNQVNGAIDVEAGPGNLFGEEERRFLERVARWAAPAVDRAQRLAELEAAQSRLVEENRNLRREREAWRPPVGRGDTDGSTSAPGAGDGAAESPPYEEALIAFERRLFAEALEQSAGSIREAARSLGIARNTLRAKLRRYGLAPAPASGPVV